MGGSLTSFIFCGFQDDAVNVNPDASSSVFRAFGEFQRSKALVCVLHFRFLQLIDVQHLVKVREKMINSATRSKR